MKRFAWIFALAVLVIGGIAGSAEAYDRTGYRYKVRYVDFDRGFYQTYNYSETCYSEYSYGMTRTTCYDVAPYDYVYVQEQTYYDSMGHRYTRVTVSRDEFGYRPVAYYNVYHDSSVRSRVVYREYNDDYGYYHHYHHYRDDYYYNTYWVVDLNWDNWETKVFLGAYTSLLGVDLIVNSHNDVGTLVGVGLFVVGKLKKASGLAQRASELQQGIEAAKKANAANTFENLR